MEWSWFLDRWGLEWSGGITVSVGVGIEVDAAEEAGSSS